MSVLEILKVIVVGIVEGFTEWLPISSTAHMMIVDAFISLDMTEDFKNIFLVLIQLGALAALVIMYFGKLNPFNPRKNSEQKAATWKLWFKIAVATVPSAILGFFVDDWIDANMRTYTVIAVTLILYGAAFIIIEKINRFKQPYILRTGQISYQTAFYIGLFQVLALVPGTSRSGATIIGAMLLGCSRALSVEFSFFLSIPVIFGAGLLKVVKYFIEGNTFSGTQIVYILLGIITAFLVSVNSIRFIIGWIKKNNFKLFGYYRIIIGSLVLISAVMSSLLV